MASKSPNKYPSYISSFSRKNNKYEILKCMLILSIYLSIYLSISNSKGNMHITKLQKNLS